MFADVFDMLFGCWHKNYSFPITTKKTNNNRSHAASVTGTYVVCLDCGKEFPYDWNQMKVVSLESEHLESAPLSAEPVGGFIKAA
jgi:predicted transcriptional regulator